MAGAGYKLFNTGDVLTAAQVNTYLMEQTVMVFDNAAARTTALTGVVSEGMISYLKDTNAVEVYNGSAWVASDDPNAIQNTIVDAKGDLIAANGNDTPARLAVGSNGDTLVADSAATTGLRYQPTTAAGKNGIINSGFDIWQRGTSFTTNGYAADRWNFYPAGVAGRTHSRQDSDLTGFAYFARTQRNNGNSDTTAIALIQSMATEESLRFAGKTVTLSFWARVGANGNGIFKPYIITGTGTDQNRAGATYTGETIVNSATVALTTSWVRYSVTVSLASNIKEIAIYFDYAPTGTAGAADYFDVTGVQLEEASVATGYMRTGGTLQGELAACQRYYWNCTTGTDAERIICTGSAFSSTAFYGFLPLKVTMRTAPTISQVTGTNFFNLDGNNTSDNFDSISAVGNATVEAVRVGVTSGITMVQGYSYWLRTNNASAVFALSAEL